MAVIENEINIEGMDICIAEAIEAFGALDLYSKIIFILILLSVCFVAFMKYSGTSLPEYSKKKIKYENKGHSKKSKSNIND